MSFTWAILRFGLGLSTVDARKANTYFSVIYYFTPGLFLKLFCVKWKLRCNGNSEAILLSWKPVSLLQCYILRSNISWQFFSQVGIVGIKNVSKGYNQKSVYRLCGVASLSHTITTDKTPKSTSWEEDTFSFQLLFRKKAELIEQWQ